MAVHESSGTPSPRVWVISDGRGLTGNLNACLGVADALSDNVETIDITEINAKGGVKAFLQEKVGLSHQGCHDAPQYIVTFMQNTAPYAAEMKSLLSPVAEKPVFLTQIRTPGKNFSAFDLIANPTHEHVIASSNVMPITGVPHRVTHETLEQGYKQWHDQLDGYNDKKKITVLLGGDTPSLPDYPNQGGAFTAEEAAALGKHVNAIAKKEGAYLLITNSPRTKPETWQAFMKEITVDGYFHDVNIDTQNRKKGNPYFGLLHAADKIIVTADSMSMLCEAASTGKPVLVACENAKNLRDDHKQFVSDFISKGFAQKLSELTALEDEVQYPKPLNTAQDIADEAKRRYATLLDRSHMLTA